MDTTSLDEKIRSSNESTLPDLLQERARSHPDDRAIVFGSESLTFRELATRSSTVAAYLRHAGVEPDGRVGIFAEPSIELMEGIWGILSSGGAYLPLSPDYPDDRLHYMIADSGTEVVFSQEELVARLAALVPPGTRIVTPRDVAEFARRHSDGGGVADPGLRPDNLAYVIYTSGSTGKPKGVMIEHRSVLNQLCWLNDVHGIGRRTTVLQKTPMSFDAAQWEILAPGCGSEVVLSSPGEYRDAESLIRTIRRHGVTALQCVPTLLHALLGTDRFHECESLSQIFSGGEALSKTLASRCCEVMPNCDLINLYGPTEATINTSTHTVVPAEVDDGPDAISIGTPVANTYYSIRNGDRNPVATGEVGDLYIGGVQLARGYLHRPELTAERFVEDPIDPDYRLFHTGDLAYWNADGTAQFVGRADNQVKLRGFRVELDEIRLAIENHDWVRNAAVVVRDDPRTGFQNLISLIELNPREAALMDQGNHGAHHQSKSSRVQVRAQLAGAGGRDPEEIDGRAVVDLPGPVDPAKQRRQAFARKTYRTYEGGDVTRDDILRLLAEPFTGTAPGEAATVGVAELGDILRYFGQHSSDERLLPKYGYASPGSLYATQMYVELHDIGDLAAGFYYYNQTDHQLVLVRAKEEVAPAARISVHFVGKRRAIEPIYKNNIQEVLEIETGHIVGLFEKILPEYGLTIVHRDHTPSATDDLDCADEDHHLGSFDIVAGTSTTELPLDVYVQAHPGRVSGLPAGQYRYRDGDLERISDELVQRRHVIAINQQVYERSGFGITVISRTGDDRLSYIDLGRALQHLSMNGLNLGFMSAGYSSKTGADLPAARRIDSILTDAGLPSGPSYFFVGGRVSDEQVRDEGMREDTVHMKGPAEMIRDDLVDFLPDYMLPNRVEVLDALPTTANGKIDVRALEERADAVVAQDDRPFVPPRSTTEQRVATLWARSLERDAVSVHDDFFASGGNSLIAVSLINKLNRELGTSLPLQVIFETPTIEKLATRIDGESPGTRSRLVPLRPSGVGNPVFCWPGLGGYPMNLRLLAGTLALDRPFYGVQADGINPGERIHPTVQEMAAHDVEEIRRLQPEGPHTLWGYSFGARVAFEAAYQLERAGHEVENLFLLAPGSPAVEADGGEIAYRDRAYVTILFSVFAGRTTGSDLQECLRVVHDDADFAEFVAARFPHLDVELVKRITAVVQRTYSFEYDFPELARRRMNAPVTIFKAAGDDYSFLEGSSGYSADPPTVVELDADHYGLLREPGVDELATAIRHRLRRTEQENIVPHVNIKHFPVSLSDERQSALVTAMTKALTSAFNCDEEAISIALEPVDKEVWNDRVYVPEIINRKELLRKLPNY